MDRVKTMLLKQFWLNNNMLVIDILVNKDPLSWSEMFCVLETVCFQPSEEFLLCIFGRDSKCISHLLTDIFVCPIYLQVDVSIQTQKQFTQ